MLLNNKASGSPCHMKQQGSSHWLVAPPAVKLPAILYLEVPAAFNGSREQDRSPRRRVQVFFHSNTSPALDVQGSQLRDVQGTSPQPLDNTNEVDRFMSHRLVLTKLASEPTNPCGPFSPTSF